MLSSREFKNDVGKIGETSTLKNRVLKSFEHINPERTPGTERAAHYWPSIEFIAFPLMQLNAPR
jgi:hypothetical protein